MARSHRTKEEMYPLMERYLGSGQTQKAFSAAHGLPKAVFIYWLSKYRRDQESAFVEITVPEEALAEVTYPSGVRLRLLAPVSAEYLARLLEAS